MSDVTYRIPLGNILFTMQGVFVVLRLAGIVDWAWWQVLMPGFVWLAIIGVCFVLVVILSIIVHRRGST